MQNEGDTSDGFVRVRHRRVMCYSSDEWKVVQNFLNAYPKIQNIQSAVKQPVLVEYFKNGWRFCAVETSRDEFKEDTAHEYAYYTIPGNLWGDRIVMSKKI